MNSSITLADAAELYLAFLAHQGKSKRTLDTYQRDLQQILAFFGSDRFINNIPLSLMGRFLKSDALLKLSSGQARAPQTINKTIRVFRMLMQWLVQVGYLPEVILLKRIQGKRKAAGSAGLTTSLRLDC